MGLLDILVGRRKLDKPAEDRLFAVSTAYVTFQTRLGLSSRGSAAIVFQSLATADFASIVRDMKEVVTATASDSQTQVETSEDSYGFSWLILRGADFDSLVVGINAVSAALQDAGYGERILCAVFAFQDADPADPARPRPVYWIYNYKRGFFYPFVPAGGGNERDSERELVLKAQVGAELPVEPELQRWFPLWGIPV
jgi:PspA associated protein B